jgi:hypothetical protein
MVIYSVGGIEDLTTIIIPHFEKISIANSKGC